MQSCVNIAAYLLDGELSLRHLRDVPLPGWFYGDLHGINAGNKKPAARDRLQV
jgi:hypothetical protein